MSVFYHGEPQPNSFKGCKYITASLKEAFSHCRKLNRRLLEEEHESLISDSEDEQEEVVSEIRRRAMEKLRRKPSFMADIFPGAFSPSYIDSLSTPTRADNEKQDIQEENHGHADDETEEFASIGSCFTSCTSVVSSREQYHSVRTNLSRSSSFNDLEFREFRRRAITQDILCQCEGWPFGLCRKLVLLPPLPKSPTESWTWLKRSRMIKICL